MPITVGGTQITFNDGTTQNTAVRQNGTTTSSAVDITLTATSDQVQNVTMTASGKAVILPNATTLTKGSAVFQICNTGNLPFYVENAAGSVLAFLLPTQATLLTLVDNSTSSGVWASPAQEYAFELLGTSVSSQTASSTSRFSAAMLSDSLLVVGYYDGTNIRIMAGSISGSTVTFGTPQTLKTGTNGEINATVAMSSTQCFVAYSTGITGSTHSAFVRGISVSGTTITLGTETTVTTNVVGNLSKTVSAKLFGSTVVFSYRGSDNGGNQLGFLRAATISGSTLTLGTAVSSSITAAYGIMAVDSSTFLWSYADNSFAIRARFYTVSGTTLTAQGVVQTPSTAYTLDDGVLAEPGVFVGPSGGGAFGAFNGYRLEFSGYTTSNFSLVTPMMNPLFLLAGAPVAAARTSLYTYAYNSYDFENYPVSLTPGFLGSNGDGVGTSSSFAAQPLGAAGANRYVSIALYKKV